MNVERQLTILLFLRCKLTMTKSRSVGACASSSVRSPSLSTLLVRSSRARIFMCIVVCETCANFVFEFLCAKVSHPLVPSWLIPPGGKGQYILLAAGNEEDWNGVHESY